MSETNNTIKSKQNQYHHLKTPLEALLEEFNDKNIINKIYKLQEKINC